MRKNLAQELFGLKLIIHLFILFFLQETEKEVETLSRYKRQLENTNSRLESELEETKKLMASRDQVSMGGLYCKYIM